MFAAAAPGAARAVALSRARLAVGRARARGPARPCGWRPPRRAAVSSAARRADAQIPPVSAMDFDKRPGELPPGEAAALAAALRGAPPVILGSASYSRNRASGVRSLADGR